MAEANTTAIRESRLIPAFAFAFALLFVGLIGFCELEALPRSIAVSAGAIFMLAAGRVVFWPRAILRPEGNDLLCEDFRNRQCLRIPMDSITEVQLRKSLDARGYDGNGFRQDIIVTTTERNYEIELLMTPNVSRARLLSIVSGWISQAANRQIRTRLSGWGLPPSEG